MLFISKKFIIIFFLSIIILGTPAVWSSDLEKIKKIDNPISLKNLDFFDFNKSRVAIIDDNTDFYILNFWASWCAPCIKEMKSLNNLKKMLPNIKVITISQDADINDAINFFKKNKYKNLEKYYDYEKSVSKNFSLRGLPTTFIFDKSVNTFAKIEGIIEWDTEEFTKWLKSN